MTARLFAALLGLIAGLVTAPLAFIMAEWGFEFLQLLNRSQNENR